MDTGCFLSVFIGGKRIFIPLTPDFGSSKESAENCRRLETLVCEDWLAAGKISPPRCPL
jgi:hypothetical protein